MVITETGAGKAVTKVMPSFENKLTANAVRVPTPNGSLAIMNLTLNKEVSRDEVLNTLRKNALQGELVNQIKYSIEEELVQQKLNYANAMNVYFSGEPIDSVISILNLASEGRQSNYRTSAQRVKSAISKINNLNMLVVPDSTGVVDSLALTKLDSIYYNLGDIFDYELGLKDSAQFYYKKVLNDFEHSTFRHKTLFALNELDSNGVWGTLISVEFPDSIMVVDSTRSVNGIITDSLNEEFVKSQNDLLNLLVVASESFIKPEIDTLLADDKLDSAVVEMELPEFSLPEFPLIEEMIPEIIETKEIDEDVTSQDAEIDSINQILTDTLNTELINTDSNVVVQEILEFQVDNIWTEHVVYYGESLSSISQKELGSEKYWNSIYEWNKEVLGKNSALIFPYQILKIRKPASYEIEIVFDDLYIVSTGETLWSIAKTIYKDEYAWSLLLHDNKETLENPDIIYPGYSLVIRAQFVELRNDN